MPYPASPIAFDPQDYATHQALQRTAAFGKTADASIRQKVIDYVVTAHAFNKDATTKSLAYDATLNQPGRNVAGDIVIGPEAFDQDLAWLSGVVFHELVHSPQYAYYVSRGVTQIDPKASETERRMIALDEYEAYWWTLKRAAELDLSPAQQSDIRRRAAFNLIELDDPTAHKLAQNQRFDAARDELIRQYSPKPATTRPSVSRPRSSSCCT